MNEGLTKKDLARLKAITDAIHEEVSKAYTTVFNRFDEEPDDPLYLDMEHHFANLEGHIHDAVRTLKDAGI